jgi:hypothetical protein
MPTTYHVEGHGVSGYVNVNDDGPDAEQQAALDSLADPVGIAERDFQLAHPEAMDAAGATASRGVEVTRERGADVFEAEGRTFTVTEFLAFAEEVDKRPAPPTTAEKVATALTSLPELGDESKRKLIEALKQ